MTFNEFINEECTACGGDWSRMLMSGIHRVWPTYWAALADRSYTFIELHDMVERLLASRKYNVVRNSHKDHLIKEYEKYCLCYYSSFEVAYEVYKGCKRVSTTNTIHYPLPDRHLLYNDEPMWLVIIEK